MNQKISNVVLLATVKTVASKTAVSGDIEFESVVILEGYRPLNFTKIGEIKL
jgi:hypothetical protein